MDDKIYDKLMILGDAAKYDVSCSSSGYSGNKTKKLGNTLASGICHTWSADGRCISLLKLLMSNECIFNCKYCINRSGNDVKRASFTPEEIADLTIEFYRRNYIEGLFLSSAIQKNPNYIMEKMVKALKILRNEKQFNGYIHVKAIPGADEKLIEEAGILADRMSVNIELPTEEGLKILAPEKKLKNLFLPMNQIKNGILQNNEEKRKFKKAPRFVPAGQSTQMIVGATDETDKDILLRSNFLYSKFNLKRVYYSAYVPVNSDKNLPSIYTTPPMLREHRIYQADWLMRFYKFNVDEIVSDNMKNLDLDFDPKMMWALNNINLFPIEINKASYNELLRIPGIGPESAYKIIRQRKYAFINEYSVYKLGFSLKRAKYFMLCNGKYLGGIEINPETIKKQLKPKPYFEQLKINLDVN